LKGGREYGTKATFFRDIGVWVDALVVSVFGQKEQNMQDPLVMPEPEKPSPVLASRMSRLLAALVDGLLGGGPVSHIIGIGILEGGLRGYPGLLIVWLVASITVFVVQCVLLSKYGQTIGKMVLRIRIVKTSTGENGGFVTNVLLREIVSSIPGIVPFVGGAWGLVDVLFVFRDDRRCIHDLIAGTHVIDLRPSDEIERANLGVWERYKRAGEGPGPGAM
jgi:uncharacterized RDD family membrane protein YckC